MKNKLRREILESNKLLPREQREEKSQSINRLLHQLIDNKVQSIALFYPMSSEPNIIPFIEELLKREKKVSLPVITNAKNRAMVFHTFSSLDELKKSTYNIPAPMNGEIVTEFDVVIVPSVSVNNKFKRLGMGGGFYDTFLENVDATFITPLYDNRCFKQFNAEKWDITIDYVVSEKQVYHSKATIKE